MLKRGDLTNEFSKAFKEKIPFKIFSSDDYFTIFLDGYELILECGSSIIRDIDGNYKFTPFSSLYV